MPDRRAEATPDLPKLDCNLYWSCITLLVSLVCVVLQRFSVQSCVLPPVLGMSQSRLSWLSQQVWRLADNQSFLVQSVSTPRDVLLSCFINRHEVWCKSIGQHHTQQHVRVWYLKSESFTRSCKTVLRSTKCAHFTRWFFQYYLRSNGIDVDDFLRKCCDRLRSDAFTTLGIYPA